MMRAAHIAAFCLLTGSQAHAADIITHYLPGAGGIEGKFETKWPDKNGKCVPHTLDDVRLGRSRYVTLASDRSRLGQYVNLGTIRYTSPIDHLLHVLTGVLGFVHDTGSAFVGRPDKLDIAIADGRCCLAQRQATRRNARRRQPARRVKQ